MGSGKSTLGPILANTLGYGFVDLDRLIEERAGKSISELFRDAGEKEFRQLELAALLDVVKMTEMVVSLGGGAIANEESFQLIHTYGVIVYLRMSAEEATRRMRHKVNRPLLKGADGETLDENALKEKITDLMRRREEFYGRADVIIQTDQQRIGSTVDDLVRQLRILRIS
jgi:shikimate kinase